MNPPETLSVSMAIGLSAASFLVFWIVFVISWLVSARKSNVFLKFETHQKADWCSRVNSTIHAAVVSFGLTITFFLQSWSEDLLPLNSTVPSSVLFCISIGYFFTDLMIIVAWLVPMWPVFVIHHTVALIPYCIFSLAPIRGLVMFYGLNLFLLVEYATLPLNAKSFLEQSGRASSFLYSFSFYANYVVWFLSRVLLPLYLMYYMWAYALPLFSSSPGIVVVSLLCGHVIVLFCVGVFLFVLTGEVIERWRGIEKMQALEEATPSTPLLCGKHHSLSLRSSPRGEGGEGGERESTPGRRKSLGEVFASEVGVEEVMEIIHQGVDLSRPDSHYFKEEGVGSFVR